MGMTMTEARYVAIARAAAIAEGAGVARRSSRRCDAGRISGPKSRACLCPCASNQQIKTSPARQCKRQSARGTPSTSNEPSTPILSCTGCSRPYCRHDRYAMANASTAKGNLGSLGTLLANIDTGASTIRATSQTATIRDGRHSRRQIADSLDECGEYGIGHLLIPHEPPPQFVVFGIQKL